MISHGNIKIGAIPNWSLSPKASCPGMTFDTVQADGTVLKGCDSVCYVGGDKGYIRVFKTAGVAYHKNMDDTLLDPDWMVPVMRFLSKNKPTLFRIHVSGDFYSPKYIGEWERIMRLFPQTKFLAYTRSWRLPRLRKELNRVRKMDNVVIYASLDAVAHKVPAGWKKAWMGSPLDGDRTIQCPGYTPEGKPTDRKCIDCKICFNAKAPNVYFPVHR